MIFKKISILLLLVFCTIKTSESCHHSRYHTCGCSSKTKPDTTGEPNYNIQHKNKLDEVSKKYNTLFTTKIGDYHSSIPLEYHQPDITSDGNIHLNPLSYSTDNDGPQGASYLNEHPYLTEAMLKQMWLSYQLGNAHIPNQEQNEIFYTKTGRATPLIKVINKPDKQQDSDLNGSRFLSESLLEQQFHANLHKGISNSKENQNNNSDSDHNRNENNGNYASDLNEHPYLTEAMLKQMWLSYQLGNAHIPNQEQNEIFYTKTGRATPLINVINKPDKQQDSDLNGSRFLSESLLKQQFHANLNKGISNSKEKQNNNSDSDHNRNENNGNYASDLNEHPYLTEAMLKQMWLSYQLGNAHIPNQEQNEIFYTKTGRATPLINVINKPDKQQDSDLNGSRFLSESLLKQQFHANLNKGISNSKEKQNNNSDSDHNRNENNGNYASDLNEHPYLTEAMLKQMWLSYQLGNAHIPNQEQNEIFYTKTGRATPLIKVINKPDKQQDSDLNGSRFLSESLLEQQFHANLHKGISNSKEKQNNNSDSDHNRNENNGNYASDLNEHPYLTEAMLKQMWLSYQLGNAHIPNQEQNEIFYTKTGRATPLINVINKPDKQQDSDLNGSRFLSESLLKQQFHANLNKGISNSKEKQNNNSDSDHNRNENNGNYASDLNEHPYLTEAMLKQMWLSYQLGNAHIPNQEQNEIFYTKTGRATPLINVINKPDKQQDSDLNGSRFLSESLLKQQFHANLNKGISNSKEKQNNNSDSDHNRNENNGNYASDLNEHPYLTEAMLKQMWLSYQLGNAHIPNQEQNEIFYTKTGRATPLINVINKPDKQQDSDLNGSRFLSESLLKQQFHANLNKGISNSKEKQNNNSDSDHNRNENNGNYASDLNEHPYLTEAMLKQMWLSYQLGNAHIPNQEQNEIFYTKTGRATPLINVINKPDKQQDSDLNGSRFLSESLLKQQFHANLNKGISNSKEKQNNNSDSDHNRNENNGNYASDLNEHPYLTEAMLKQMWLSYQLGNAHIPNQEQNEIFYTKTGRATPLINVINKPDKQQDSDLNGSRFLSESLLKQQFHANLNKGISNSKEKQNNNSDSDHNRNENNGNYASDLNEHPYLTEAMLKQMWLSYQLGNAHIPNQEQNEIFYTKTGRATPLINVINKPDKQQDSDLNGSRFLSESLLKQQFHANLNKGISNSKEKQNNNSDSDHNRNENNGNYASDLNEHPYLTEAMLKQMWLSYQLGNAHIPNQEQNEIFYTKTGRATPLINVINKPDKQQDSDLNGSRFLSESLLKQQFHANLNKGISNSKEKQNNNSDSDHNRNENNGNYASDLNEHPYLTEAMLKQMWLSYQLGNAHIPNQEQNEIFYTKTGRATPLINVINKPDKQQDSDLNGSRFLSESLLEQQFHANLHKGISNSKEKQNNNSDSDHNRNENNGNYESRVMSLGASLGELNFPHYNDIKNSDQQLTNLLPPQIMPFVEYAVGKQQGNHPADTKPYKNVLNTIPYEYYSKLIPNENLKFTNYELNNINNQQEKYPLRPQMYENVDYNVPYTYYSELVPEKTFGNKNYDVKKLDSQQDDLPVYPQTDTNGNLDYNMPSRYDLNNEQRHPIPVTHIAPDRMPPTQQEPNKLSKWVTEQIEMLNNKYQDADNRPYSKEFKFIDQEELESDGGRLFVPHMEFQEQPIDILTRRHNLPGTVASKYLDSSRIHMPSLSSILGIEFRSKNLPVNNVKSLQNNAAAEISNESSAISGVIGKFSIPTEALRNLNLLKKDIPVGEQTVPSGRLQIVGENAKQTIGNKQGLHTIPLGYTGVDVAQNILHSINSFEKLDNGSRSGVQPVLPDIRPDVHDGNNAFDLKENDDDDDGDFRIIGGNAATGSGTPLSNKGRSGYVI